MKKILVALCAVALVGFTACKKDKVAPDEPTYQGSGNQGGQGGQNDPPQTGWADKPGVYSPSAKIDSVLEEGILTETWTWENDLLTAVSDANGNEKVRFTHDNQGRVKTMTVNSESMASGTVNVNYNGDKISSLSLMNGTEEMLSATLSYSGDKISGGELDVSDNMILELFNTMVAQFLGGSDAEDMVTGIDEVMGSVSFNWNGDNVSESFLSISARLKTTLGKIVEMIPDMSVFGSYGTVIQNLASIYPDREVYIKASMKDTANYSYNSNIKNPMRRNLGAAISLDGYMPSFEVITMTQDPLAHEQHNSSANAEILIQLYGNNPTSVYEQSLPLASDETSYTYTSTRADGYPETVDDGASIKTYIYQAK